VAVLSESAARLFAYLPATYGADPEDVDPVVARWLEALAFELDRIRAVLEALRSTTIPAAADDTVGGLGRWESMLRLPVQPEGASVAQRRAAVIARLRSRRVASGLDWTDSVTAMLGTDAWTVEENTPAGNQLSLRFPYVPGSYTGAQVAQLVRERTPANQEILIGFAEGFIVGVSEVGELI
jgi:hypothetical protein